MEMKSRFEQELSEQLSIIEQVRKALASGKCVTANVPSTGEVVLCRISEENAPGGYVLGTDPHAFRVDGSGGGFWNPHTLHIGD